MKNQVILLIIGLLITAGCYAQNKYPKGITKQGGQQFQIEYPDPDNELIVVYNVRNKYAQGGPGSDNPNPRPYKREDIHFDVAAAKETIKQVLKPKNEKLRENEDHVLVHLVFDQSGKLSDITYALKANTLISLKDIAEIDAQLRKTLRAATFTGKTFKDHKFFRYSLGMIRFE